MRTRMLIRNESLRVSSSKSFVVTAPAFSEWALFLKMKQRCQCRFSERRKLLAKKTSLWFSSIAPTAPKAVSPAGTHHLRLKGNGRVMDSVQFAVPNVRFAWFQASVWMSIINCVEPGRFTIVTLLSHSTHSRRIEPVRGEGSGTRVPGQTGP